VDCWGAAQPAVRYDSPTWGGFRFETSYGKNQLTSAFGNAPFLFEGIGTDFATGNAFDIDSSELDFWDIAVFYTADWNSIKVSAAAAYTWIETAAVTVASNCFGGVLSDCTSGTGDEGALYQVGGSIMHKPSGLGIYGMWQREETDGRRFFLDDEGDISRFFSFPETDAWYVKPFWRKAWSPIGATVLFAEYGRYEDQFGNLVGVDLEDAFTGNSGGLPVCEANFDDCFVSGSEAERWGLGIVQEIDSAAMHLWLRWQHQELDVDFVAIGNSVAGDGCDGTCRFGQGFDDWDLFQAGGIIFF
jgi:hypothetical protein